MEPDLSLAELLANCFEKNELIDGYYTRFAPFPDEGVAAARFEAWCAELSRWQGVTPRRDSGPTWQRAEWPQFRLKQAGRGVCLWVRGGSSFGWWGKDEAWRGNPVDEAMEWDATAAVATARCLQAEGDALLDSKAGAAPMLALAMELRRRDWTGDDILAAALEAVAGGREPDGAPVPCDLDALAMVRESEEGGWFDRQSGEAWPDNPDGYDEEFDRDDPRWLYVDPEHSREGYRDMERFIQTLGDGPGRVRLERAIEGRGAFRRFKDAVAALGLRDDWFRYADDRSHGRARAWLAEQGLRRVARQ